MMLDLIRQECDRRGICGGGMELRNGPSGELVGVIIGGFGESPAVIISGKAASGDYPVEQHQGLVVVLDDRIGPERRIYESCDGPANAQQDAQRAIQAAVDALPYLTD